MFKQFNNIVFFIFLIPYSGLFRLYSKMNMSKMLKSRFFNKILILFGYCQIKSTYSELARRELSIGTLILFKFSILNFSHIMGKRRTLPQKNKIFFIFC